MAGTSKVIIGGRITIDSAIRQALNIEEGDTVEYQITQVIKAKKVNKSGSTRQGLSADKK